MKLEMPKTYAALACAALLPILVGCVAVPPDHPAVSKQDAASARLASDIHAGRDAWPQSQWWTQYGDAQLNELMDKALTGSPTLKAAAARLGSAQAVLTQNEAAQGMGVNFNAGINRQHYSANGLFPPPIGGSTYTEEMVQVQARYDFDWWGKHRSQIAAAIGEENAQRAELAQARETLAAAIAQAYFNLQAGWARRANLDKTQALQQEVVADQTRRVNHGLASIDAQRSAEGRLAELKKQLAQLDAQNIREREALRALAALDADALAGLKPVPLPQTPAALPSRLGLELLARRPDLQAARWRVEASLKRVDAARAAFYPDVNLTGSFGADALDIGRLLGSGSHTFFIGPALSLPLFNSKTLKGQLGEARNGRDEMIADYNQSVFNAVRDVAQAGAARQGIDAEWTQQAAALESTSALLRATEARFKRGLADRAGTLDTRMAMLKQNDASLELQQRRLTADIALIKALGGGYRAADMPQAHADSSSGSAATN